MLIGWATPFNVLSAIGKFSRFVCDELRSRGHEIEIIRTEAGPDLDMQSLKSDLPITNAARCDVDRYDVLAVNFGNHAPYHGQLISLLSRRAPVGIFHDIEMRHFEEHLLRRYAISLPRLVGSEHELPEVDDKDLVDPDARPLLGLFAAMCIGAVVHGPHYRSTVSRYCSGHVKLIPLCFPDTGKARVAQPRSSGRRVVIFGVITEHKQPDRVLRALGALTTNVGKIDLHLVGTCGDGLRASLEELADELGVGRPKFHGFVSDERLQEILEDCHAICCLRYPVTEGGSASLITALHRARPVVVSDIASFSLVPDGVAYKVSYSDDSADVAQALGRIFRAPDEAEKKAVKAAMWARDGFSARAYVDALEPLLHSIKEGSTLTHTARALVRAVTTPDHEPILVAVQEFADVLDWTEASK